ncbi:MAG: S8 family serine peptidase [Bacteroidales bacterium]
MKILLADGHSSSDVVMSTFSSWGPTDDGRIKPDIVANGVNLYSCDDDADNDYTYKDGTSMAAPSTTGTLALLQDYYQSMRSGTMSATSLKGLAINTANEAGSANGPDYKFGWGLLNATGAADLITQDDAEGGLIVEGVIEDGQNIYYTYYSDGTSDINVTLCWNDPAHAPITPALNPTTSTLVHDLDLYITDPSSTLHYPWRLNPSSPSSPATNTSYNYRDNVERVDIYSPAAGYYTILVDEFSTIPAGGQSYSLIIRGLETEPSLETYCIGNPPRSTSDYEYIENVTFGDINNSSNLSPGGYANYTGLIEEVTKGGSETITVTIGNYYSTSDVVYAWVDWNQDGDFDDSGEEYNLGNTAVVTGTISIPTDALSGYTTMRVRMKYGTPLPCGNQSFSETEDYTLHVLGLPGLWTGLAGTSSWHATNNWDDLTIPTSTTNVTIPAGTPASPGIWLTNAYCNNITIESGANLSVYDDSGSGETLRLYVSNDMNVHGNVYMWGGSESYDGEIEVGHDINWYNGSQLHTSANQIIRIYGDWYMWSGADVHMDNGTLMFMGTVAAYIQSNEPTCYLNNVSSYKTGGAYIGFSYLSTADIYINGDMYIQSGAGFNGYNTNTIHLQGDLNNHGTFIYNYGTLAMTGSSQYIRLNAGCYLNDFTVNSTGTVYFVNTYSNSLTVNGNVEITSGALNCGANIIEVGGDWTNTVGTSGFLESTGRVVFNGPGPDMQFIQSNETFNVLENNTFQAIRINTNITVECNSYDWTSGSVSVVAGTFIANDLFDDGLYGSWYALSNSEIYLNQNVGQYVDVFSPTIHIHGNGLIKVTGGDDESYWCSGSTLNLEIDEGVLDFDGYGITIFNTNLLTESITNGSIKTSGWFTNYRTDFNPTAGTFEFYGGTDARINVAAGSSFHDLLINKSGGDKSAIQYKDRDGTEIKSSKANAVTLYNSMDITNDLTISNGSLVISTYSATIDGDCYINGSLDVGISGNVMNHGLFEQGVTGTLSMSGGSFINDHPYGAKAWQYLHGTLYLSAGLFEIMHNSILLESTFIDNITGGTMRTGMSFRALTPGTFQPSGGNFEFTGLGASGPFIDCPVGNYFNDIDISGPNDYVIYANTEVLGNVNINGGNLDLLGFDLSCFGNFYVNTGGYAKVDNGSLLKFDAGSILYVAAGGEIQLVGTAGNEAKVTHISSGNYGFSIFGTIGAQHAIFEFMDGNGINVKTTGSVDPVYPFNNCRFQKGAPSPSALLVLNNDQSFTCNNAYFENTYGNTQYNVWKYYNEGNTVTFADASGDFDGEDFDYDPYNQIFWTYTTRTLDLTVFLEGPFNGSTNKIDLGLNSILPLNQPFDTPPLSNPSPDWYYTGTESVGAIPNPYIADWILVQLRDAPTAASAIPATAFFTQAAFITNTGQIVDLDGVSPLTFTGTIANNLYAVVWTRNHLGVISAYPLVEVAGLFSYNFSTGSGQALGGTNAQKLLSGSPVIWGMMSGDANGTGLVAIGDKTNVWNLQTGEFGYLESDYNYDGQVENTDKNDYWLPNNGKGSQIPE